MGIGSAGDTIGCIGGMGSCKGGTMGDGTGGTGAGGADGTDRASTIPTFIICS